MMKTGIAAGLLWFCTITLAQAQSSPCTAPMPDQGDAPAATYRHPFLATGCVTLFRQAKHFFAPPQALFPSPQTREAFIKAIHAPRREQPQAWLLHYPEDDYYQGVMLVDSHMAVFDQLERLTADTPLLRTHLAALIYFHEMAHLSPQLTFGRFTPAEQESLGDLFAVVATARVAGLSEAAAASLAEALITLRQATVDAGTAMPERIKPALTARLLKHVDIARLLTLEREAQLHALVRAALSGVTSK